MMMRANIFDIDVMKKSAASKLFPAYIVLTFSFAKGAINYQIMPTIVIVAVFLHLKKILFKSKGTLPKNKLV